MANFAVIRSNKLVNIIVAETLEDAEINTNAQCVELTSEHGVVNLGDTYDATTGSFTKPEVNE